MRYSVVPVPWQVVVAVQLVGLPTLVPAAAPLAAPPEAVTRLRCAETYLCLEMDRWTQGSIVFDDHQSGGCLFQPSNWIGDCEDISIDSRFAAHKVCGTTCMKISYRPLRGIDRWAGVQFVYPDRNFGDHRGRDLSGSTCLSGWIGGKGIVQLQIGGIGDHAQPFPDGFCEGGRIRLAPTFSRFRIPIPENANLRSVIGGLTILFEKKDNPGGCVVYLDEVAYDDPSPARLRLIRSYAPEAGEEDDWIRQAAHVYDNSACILALLARGDDEGTKRARMLGDALCWAQLHDRYFKDGRWRNAYCCGPLEDPVTGTARIPGIYREDRKRFHEDWFSAGSDTGNVAWAVIALASLAALTEPSDTNSSYLRAAATGAEWIERNCRVNDDFGGYCGGFEGPEPNRKTPVQNKLAWRSTEHNLDCAVAFAKLARLTSDREKWLERARHARSFVWRMWCTNGYFCAGTKDQEGTINQIVPMDAQTWAVLALGYYKEEFRKTVGWADNSPHPPCLKWVERTCRVQFDEAKGYQFSDLGNRTIWPEGSAHLAAAYHCLGDQAAASRVLSEIVQLSPVASPPRAAPIGVGGPSPIGGILAAYRQPAATGFLKKYGFGEAEMWVYKPRQHIGATAWFALASRGCNPFWLEGPPESESQAEPAP